MAQERTGIVVGTNKGHVRSSPILHASSLPRVSVLSGPFFRVEPSRGFKVHYTTASTQQIGKELSVCRQKGDGGGG